MGRELGVSGATGSGVRELLLLTAASVRGGDGDTRATGRADDPIRITTQHNTTQRQIIHRCDRIVRSSPRPHH